MLYECCKFKLDHCIFDLSFLNDFGPYSRTKRVFSLNSHFNQTAFKLKTILAPIRAIAVKHVYSKFNNLKIKSVLNLI